MRAAELRDALQRSVGDAFVIVPAADSVEAMKAVVRIAELDIHLASLARAVLMPSDSEADALFAHVVKCHGVQSATIGGHAERERVTDSALAEYAATIRQLRLAIKGIWQRRRMAGISGGTCPRCGHDDVYCDSDKDKPRCDGECPDDNVMLCSGAYCDFCGWTVDGHPAPNQ